MLKKKIENKDIIEALNSRYAVKIFDPTKKVSDQDLKTILESARLSPSSDGFEMWKFIVVTDPEVRKKIRAVGFDQPKITDASHLIVICYRTDPENIIRERLERTAKTQNQKVEELDEYKAYLESAIGTRVKDGSFLSWSLAMSCIPLGIMVETATLLGIDNGPMSGFYPDKVDEILGLKEKNLRSATMLALGYRGDDPAATKPKVRRDFSEVIEFI